MIRSFARATALAYLVLFLAAPSAFAQTSAEASPKVAELGNTAVIIPWGDIVVAVAQTATQVLTPFLVAGVMIGLAKLFPRLSRLVSASLIERFVTNATAFALNAVDGAAKGRTLPINVGRAVIARAAQRVADQAPAAVLRSAGGVQGVAEKVFRHLDLEPAATAANTLAPAVDRMTRSSEA